MLGKLVPWKKRNGRGDITVRPEEDFGLSQFRDEFNSLWDRFWDDWRGGLANWNGGTWFRGVNLNEEEKEFVLHAELPGFEPDDIDIKVSGNMLTVRAEHKDEGNGKNGSRYQRYGSFFESFSLPSGVEADNIDARYHSGVLEVHLPKSKDYETKRIPVTAA
ncbi:MAG TPA: Hsp20/alpha crystallin family protein [Pirellulaceae bacterium]|nr:Hsp20/alpha crystallin family protein [Pirellulaceae bacterium]